MTDSVSELLSDIREHLEDGNRPVPSGTDPNEAVRRHSAVSEELLSRSVVELQNLRSKTFIDKSGVSVSLRDLLFKHVEDPIPGTPRPVLALLRQMHEELSRPAPIKEFKGVESGGTYYTFQVDGHLGDEETLLNRLLDGVLNLSGDLRVQDKVSVLRYWIDRINRKSEQTRSQDYDPF